MSPLVIGHIMLAPEFDRGAECLLRLTSLLAELGVQQHALVANGRLATRLEARAGMPVVRCASSAVEACCDLQACDLVHAHDAEAGKAALLLKLTSSQRYVLTHVPSLTNGADTVLDSLNRRADCVVCTSDAAARELRRKYAEATVRVVYNGRRSLAAGSEFSQDDRGAREVLQIYRWVLQSGVDRALAQ